MRRLFNGYEVCDAEQRGLQFRVIDYLKFIYSPVCTVLHPALAGMQRLGLQIRHEVTFCKQPYKDGRITGIGDAYGMPEILIRIKDGVIDVLLLRKRLISDNA